MMCFGGRVTMVRALVAAGVVVAMSSACHRSRAAKIPIDSAGGTRDAAPRTADARPTMRIPRDAARFEIEVVDDTTLRFKPREALWVKDGMMAYAVDPMNRDALVARLRIVSVWNETAVAVIASQVTRITTRHVVLMTPPVVPWWKTRRFWLGTLVGAVVGSAAGVIASP